MTRDGYHRATQQKAAKAHLIVRHKREPGTAALIHKSGDNSMHSGTLYFEDSDPVEVRSFIVRESEIAFDLAGGWGEHGMWRRQGVALRQGREFHSDMAPSFQDGVEGYLCRIVFQTVRNGDIEGYWFENGKVRAFNGTLEATPC